MSRISPELINKYLPIGTHVILKNDPHAYMIIAFKYKKNNKTYDYGAVSFPKGYLEYDKMKYFNHEDIENIVHFGPNSNMHREYNKILNNSNK